MDEKKEFLNEEIESEETTTLDTDTTDNNQVSFEEVEASGVFSEVEEDLGISERIEAEETVAAPVAVKKKGLLQVPIIISIAILLVVVLGFLVYKCFFNTSIVGTWSVKNTATSDEASLAEDTLKSYYTFDKDGEASITIGSMSMVGTYSLAESEEDGSLTVEIYIPSVMQGSFQYTVSGNAFTGRTLILTDTYYGQSYEFEGTDLVIPELKPADDFKTNDELVGTWTYDDGYNKLSYDLRADGTATINQMDMLFAEGVYTYTDSQIIITYMAYEESEMVINYMFDNDALIIDGYMFVKEGTASADEA